METLTALARIALRPMVRAVYRYYLGLRPLNRPRLDEGAVYLFCANHASHLDALAVVFASGLPPSRFSAAAAKDYFYRSPWLRWIFQLFVEIVPLERNPSTGQMMRNLKILRRQIEAKKHIIFFPEGTRSRDGEMRCFKKGLGFVAKEIGVPAVPVYIGGAHRSWPKGRRFPRPGRIEVIFGQPVHPSPAWESATYEDIACAVHMRVVHLKRLAHESVPAGTGGDSPRRIRGRRPPSGARPRTKDNYA